MNDVDGSRLWTSYQRTSHRRSHKNVAGTVAVDICHREGESEVVRKPADASELITCFSYGPIRTNIRRGANPGCDV